MGWDRNKARGFHSRIYRRIWSNPDFLRLSRDAELVWWQLQTSPLLTQFGLSRVGPLALAEERGWAPDEFLSAWEEALAAGLGEYDPDNRLLWLPGYVDHNPPQSINVVKAWGRQFNDLPDCSLKSEAYQHLLALHDALHDAFGLAFRDAFRDAIADGISPSGGGATETTEATNNLQPTGGGIQGGGDPGVSSRVPSCPPMSPPIAEADTDPPLAGGCRGGDRDGQQPLIAKPPTQTEIEAGRLAEFLASEIRSQKADAKVAPANWVTDIERLLRIDGRKARRVAEVIRWATRHDFYATIILSGRNLRKHFDAMEIRMQKEGARTARTPGDVRERVPVPAPDGVTPRPGETAKQAIDRQQREGADPDDVRRWRYQYAEATAAIRERGDVPEEG